MLRWVVLSSVNRTLLNVTKRTFNSSVPDYYKLLDVRKDATQREIKLAYYSLSKKYHPDVAGTSQDASGRFVQINEAYECLKDPQKRRLYDNQTTGGGGRYPGDFGGPFQNYQERSWSNQQTYSNPFHNKQFTEAEYRRIWQEFERLKKQQQHQTQNDFRWSAFERDKIWSDLRRAKRWQEFHAKYPNGAPGSFRWEWKFGPESQNQYQNNARQAVRGWDLFRRIMMVYFLCFFIVSVVRVLLYSFDGKSAKSPQEAAKTMASESPTRGKESVEEMMRRVPGEPGLPAYMTTPPMSISEKNRSLSTDNQSASNLEFMMYQSPPGDRPQY